MLCRVNLWHQNILRRSFEDLWVQHMFSEIVISLPLRLWEKFHFDTVSLLGTKPNRISETAEHSENSVCKRTNIVSVWRMERKTFVIEKLLGEYSMITFVQIYSACKAMREFFFHSTSIIPSLSKHQSLNICQKTLRGLWIYW